MICEWCGGEHDQAALCRSRPKFSRRGFLALFGTGIAGAAVARLAPSGAVDRLTTPIWTEPMFVGEWGCAPPGEVVRFTVSQRKTLGGIYFTEEALHDAMEHYPDTFSQAARAEWQARMDAATQALDADLIRDSRAAHPAGSLIPRSNEP